MPLPLSPPVLPQLARPGAELPVGEGWVYEPKWDGFRAIAFVDGEDIHVQSRNGRPLGRYFPELRFPTGRYVLDGELVIRTASGGEDFEALQERIHPAASRVKMLAERTPATFVAFDLLAEGDESLLERPLTERRAALEALVADPLELTPMTADPAAAEPWLQGAEGVIAKRADAPYRPGERVGMIKVKRVRTIDCVVFGWRPGKAEGTVGSLILGLYDGDRLWPVGHTSGFTAKRARELVGVVTPYETGERGASEPNRWKPDAEDREWRSLRPELVVEVTFDHVSGRRIRHGARLLRFRDDKAPADCGIEQLDG
ncbi:MAG TPA: ATP-dependent DNA ligase [Gaiellales bacterium]|jgi:ATP-dependent DNA ligase|nr:ATP-dependent DNA ligase [Gaiellales bacterium]